MKIIGHRGASGTMPENTIPSFLRAYELGAVGVELDVHLSKDGIPIVIHDETLDRTTNDRGLVAERTAVELNEVGVPTLSGVLEALGNKGTVFIEIKADEAALPAAQLVEDLVKIKGWRYEQLVIIAFNHHLLLDIRAKHPDMFTGALLSSNPIRYAQEASDAKAQYILPNIGRLNANMVKDAHAREIKVGTWTVNSDAQIAKAKKLGVDVLMSDYPEKVIATIA